MPAPLNFASPVRPSTTSRCAAVVAVIALACCARAQTVSLPQAPGYLASFGRTSRLCDDARFKAPRLDCGQLFSPAVLGERTYESATQVSPTQPSPEQKAATLNQHGSPGHIFWVIPAYNVEYLKDVKPLTPHEKFMEVVKDTYDPQGLALGAAEAALLEHNASDGFCGYGHGWGGFGKCYGAALLDSNVSGFLGDWAFPVLMHQDPRYFRLGQGSVLTRSVYAFSRVFITRTDAGGTTVDSSALLGTVIAGVVSNTYYPHHDRGFGLTMSRIGIDLAGTAVFNLEAEFWADIKNVITGRNSDRSPLH